MVAASFTSYIGAFGIEYRNNLWKDIWLADLKSRDVPLNGSIDPWMLTSEALSATWQNEGLPADRISIENGAIVTNCSRWPLLIDPQLQGLRWLKEHERLRTEKAGKRLIIMRPGEKQWMLKIINAIQDGDSVILENVFRISMPHSILYSARASTEGSGLFIKIGDDDVDYDDNFRLILQTKMHNPHYKPEITAQCTLINFIVTRKGLETNSSHNSGEEEPELEETRNKLVQDSNKIRLKELEDELLERLANAPADILSDIPLMRAWKLRRRQ